MIHYPERPKEVRIKQDGGVFGDSIKVKLTGGRAWVVPVAMLMIVCELLDIHRDLKNSNRLQVEENQIRKEQLDLARRQFALDSIAAAKNEKNR